MEKILRLLRGEQTGGGSWWFVVVDLDPDLVVGFGSRSESLVAAEKDMAWFLFEIIFYLFLYVAYYTKLH